MAPVQLPAPVSERFLVSGLGAITLTEAQRGARSLSVTIEKVRPTNPAGVGQVISSYFNQKWPEPQSHWGYFQLMRRDFVSSGGALSYRREVIFERDNWTAEILARLRCYLEKDHDFGAVSTETILGSLAEPGLGGGTPNIDELKAVWEATLESQLFPTHPETAIWYQLADEWKAQVTLTHQPYATLNCGIEAQALPPAKVPGAGESGSDGQREDIPVPPGRRTDPLADNPSPSPDSMGSPPIPEQVPPPPPGATSTQFYFTWSAPINSQSSCTPVNQEFVMGSAPGIYPASRMGVTQTTDPTPIQCGTRIKTVVLNASQVPGYSGFPALQRAAFGDLKLKVRYN